MEKKKAIWSLLIEDMTVCTENPKESINKFSVFSKAAEYKVRNTKIYSIYINNKENKISKRIAFSFKKHVI